MLHVLLDFTTEGGAHKGEKGDYICIFPHDASTTVSFSLLSNV